MGILGELDRAGLIDTSLPTVHSNTLAEALETWNIMRSPTPAWWQPLEARPRKVSAALKAYALLATSADEGAVRDLEKLR